MNVVDFVKLSQNASHFGHFAYPSCRFLRVFFGFSSCFPQTYGLPGRFSERADFEQ